jgi:hypothetical protein
MHPMTAVSAQFTSSAEIEREKHSVGEAKNEKNLRKIATALRSRFQFE